MELTSDAYARWATDPSPDNMAAIVTSLEPMINSEIQRYPGPKPLLRSRAKNLAIKAVKTYDPMSKAQLSSWVVTQLQPLSRYGREINNPLQASELAYRQAAEVEATRKRLLDELGDDPTDDQLADEIGISPKRVHHLRETVRPVMYEGSMETPEGYIEPAERSRGTEPELKTAIELVYDSLDDRDRIIYDLKTGGHGNAALDNKSIAKRLGVSPAFISQRGAAITQLILEAKTRV
jgi:RNA polymerase primary sigma factor